MLLVVIGITYGVLIGLFGNWLLFWKLRENKRRGVEPLKGVGGIFFVRLAMDAVSIGSFAYAVRHTWAIIAAGISLTVAVKISLFIVYSRKGGRFD